jgi:hypothetical protein
MQNLRFSRRWRWRMASSGMLRRVILVRTYVSEELSASIIRVTRVCELGTTLVVDNVPSSRVFVTLMMEALSSSETSVLTTATLRNIPEEAILHRSNYFQLLSFLNMDGGSVDGYEFSTWPNEMRYCGYFLKARRVNVSCGWSANLAVSRVVSATRKLIGAMTCFKWSMLTRINKSSPIWNQGHLSQLHSL